MTGAIGLYDRRPLTVRTAPITAAYHASSASTETSNFTGGREQRRWGGGGEKEDSGKAGHLWSRGDRPRPTYTRDG
jgi:hypothetical protein